ncbi:MAG: crossover junction endodeoxyribonuclease RuvC [Candidatus Nomurabacteria bacterium]|nr:crossover junction endodeoxyribonuclease RuvC [Candidatus Nomurabacteria bacterium]
MTPDPTPRPQKQRILGIDPGTGRLGFGVIDFAKGRPAKMVDAGVISTPAHTPLDARLLDIFNSLNEIIAQTKPECVSIEKLFFTRNITTAISVAEARGVAILVAARNNLPVHEWTPGQIKQAATGYGRADKKVVQEAVRAYLNLPNVPKPDDAADALAAAIAQWTLG